MENFIGICLVIGLVALLIFFKGTLRKIAKHTEEVVIVNINEDKAELYKRSQDAWKELVNECGEDFETPLEIYNKMRKRRSQQHSNS